MDWALTRKDLTNQLTLIHRRETCRSHGATANRLSAAAEAGKLTILTPYELQAVLGDERLRKAVIVDKKTGETRNLDT